MASPSCAVILVGTDSGIYYEMEVNVSNICSETILPSAMNKQRLYFAMIIYLRLISLQHLLSIGLNMSLNMSFCQLITLWFWSRLFITWNPQSKLPATDKRTAGDMTNGSHCTHFTALPQSRVLEISRNSRTKNYT